MKVVILFLVLGVYAANYCNRGSCEEHRDCDLGVCCSGKCSLPKSRSLGESCDLDGCNSCGVGDCVEGICTRRSTRRYPGCACSSGAMCSSALCVDGICFAANISAHLPCEHSVQCQSGTCDRGFCSGTLAELGKVCLGDTDCVTQNCLNFTCVPRVVALRGEACSEECVPGFYCDSISSTCEAATFKNGNGVCNNRNVQCLPPAECSPSVDSDSFRCKSASILKDGDDCTHSIECPRGSVCNNKDYTCVPMLDEACSANVSCGHGAECACADGDFQCKLIPDDSDETSSQDCTAELLALHEVCDAECRTHLLAHARLVPERVGALLAALACCRMCHWTPETLEETVRWELQHAPFFTYDCSQVSLEVLPPFCDSTIVTTRDVITGCSAYKSKYKDAPTEDVIIAVWLLGIREDYIREDVADALGAGFAEHCYVHPEHVQYVAKSPNGNDLKFHVSLSIPAGRRDMVVELATAAAESGLLVEDVNRLVAVRARNSDVKVDEEALEVLVPDPPAPPPSSPGAMQKPRFLCIAGCALALLCLAVPRS